MHTHTMAPRHLRLYGAVLAAALAAILLAVMTLTAGPTAAEVGVDSDLLPRTGDNAEEYDDPIPCSEEAEPDARTESVITDGYYAVFDAFWDYEVGHLSNNFCPPEVTVTADLGGNTYTRGDANIHISKTAFSVPTSYEVMVVDSEEPDGNPSDVEGPKIDLADYPFLRHAVSAVEPGADSTEANPTTAFAYNTLWWVRLDEPGTPVDETSDLKIGFSTALLDRDDWYIEHGDPVQFRFSAVHVLEAGVPVEAHVVGANFFAFEERQTDTPLLAPKWSNLGTAGHSEIGMQTGEYLPMQFAFTKPGVYLVQAQVQGHVRTSRDPAPTGDDVRPNWSPINPGAATITSPTEWYAFHVGSQADLGVEITHTDETADDNTTTVTDGTASFSVTATNNGPDTAEGVVVEVSLPAGLGYAPDTSHTGVTFECGVIAWRVGDLNSGASITLSFEASVGTGAAKTLTADAEVHSSTVDDNEGNDTASVDVRTLSRVVTAPSFPGVARSIVEHAVEGAHAGDPVAALNPDGRLLTYTLEGRCASWFKVHNNGQIALAAFRTLDYYKQSEFHLTLQVSDGVNAEGKADTSADDSAPVLIQVEDTELTVHPTVTFKLTPHDSDVTLTGNPVADGSTYNLRTTLNNAPEGATLSYDWDEQGLHNPVWGNRFHSSYYPALGLQPGPKTYTVHIKWPGGGITDSYTITWDAP